MSTPLPPLQAKDPSFSDMPVADMPVSDMPVADERVSPTARTVLALIFPDALLLNAAGPLEVFAAVPRILGAAPYRILLASPRGGPVATVSGIEVVTQALAALPTTLTLDTLIVIGGPGVAALTEAPDVLTDLRRLAAVSRRLCSIGTGAFALAAAGLLDERRVVTHWKFADALQRHYPRLRVEREALYLHDGDRWTCGGAAASIDLGLALVEEDLGSQAALTLAHYFTLFLQRNADQPQLSASLKLQSNALRTDRDLRMRHLHAWIADNLSGDLRIERLAARFGMSARHFSRAYVAATGQTPAHAVVRLRLEAACRLLAVTHEPIKRIAETLGFGSEERMRRSFQRQLHLSPQDYRQQAQTRAAQEHQSPRITAERIAR